MKYDFYIDRSRFMTVVKIVVLAILSFAVAVIVAG